MKAKNPNFVALDIGSSKIVGIAAHIDKKGETKILSQTLQYSAGFRSSSITDLKAAEETVLRTIYALEKECDKSIKHVTISLCGEGTKSYYINSKIKLANTPITKIEVKKLLEKALQEFKLKNQEVILYFPLEFGLDENNSVENPLGMYGKELRCQLHVITANTSLIINLANCLAKCQIEIENIMLSIYVAGLACLTEDEKSLGSIIIDMGAKTTSFGVFFMGKLIYSGSVPMGGANITSDIAKVFSLNLTVAEKLKILYGNVYPTAFDKDKVVNIEDLGLDIQDNFNILTISKGMLSEVIAARVEEILLLIKEQYEQIGIDHLITRRLIITGGGSGLRGIKEFAGRIFNRHVRIAKPMILPGFKEEYNLPAYASLIGMVYNYALKQQKNFDVDNIDKKQANWLGKAITWVKENI